MLIMQIVCKPELHFIEVSDLKRLVSRYSKFSEAVIGHRLQCMNE